MVKRNNGKSAIQMVFMDEKGSKIDGTISQELFADFQDILICGSAYVIQNIKVVDLTSEYKVSKIPYILYFVKTTSVKEAHRPEIPPNVYTITPFADIFSGVAPRDILIDIVGLIVDVIEQYTSKPTFRVTVKLRDNSGVELIMTLWEDYAAQLGLALDKNRLEQKPLVVMLTLAKIKDPTGELHTISLP